MATRGIYLIGFSGAGKSTIAQILGTLLGWPVYDVDQLIVVQSGRSIADIFQHEGEAGFRLRETEALRSLPTNTVFIVTTGGGLPLRIENRRIMAQNGWVFALEARPETLHTRMEHQLQNADPAAIRPLLDAADPLEQIRALKHHRQSVYALADWTVHTDRLSSQQVAAEIVRAVELLATTADPLAAFDVPTR